MIAETSERHLGTDLNGTCIACGAHRDQISAGEPCRPVTGPDRILIVLARQDLYVREQGLKRQRAELEMLETAICGVQAGLRRMEDEVREIRTTLEKLGDGKPEALRNNFTKLFEIQ